jgi:integration host factor subunit beta
LERHLSRSIITSNTTFLYVPNTHYTNSHIITGVLLVTKSELIERLSIHTKDLQGKELEDSVKELLEQMAQTLQRGERIEIRGFGSFSLHYRAPRVGRNPKTGENVKLSGKHVPHFKAGKELRDRVDL